MNGYKRWKIDYINITVIIVFLLFTLKPYMIISSGCLFLTPTLLIPPLTIKKCNCHIKKDVEASY